MVLTNDLENLFEQALHHHRHKRWEQALKTYQELKQHLPASAEVAYLMTDILHKTNQADTSPSHVPETAPCSLEQELAIGYIFLRLNSFEAAHMAFERALKVDPENTEARIGVSRLHTLKQKYLDAEHILKDILSHHPDSQMAHIEIGKLYLKMRLYDKSLVYVLQVLNTDPDNKEMQEVMLELLPSMSENVWSETTDALLARFIDRIDIESHPAIIHVLVNALKKNTATLEMITYCLQGKWSEFYDGFQSLDIRPILTSAVLVSMFASSPIKNVYLIALFIGFRRSILKYYLQHTVLPSWMHPLAAALSIQSFKTGFLRPAFGSEINAVSIIKHQIHQYNSKETTHIAPLLAKMVIVGMFESILYISEALTYQKYIEKTDNQYWRSVLRHHILEPLREQKLTRLIPAYSQPVDQTSQKIFKQYSIYPSPRWQNPNYLSFKTLGDLLACEIPDIPVPALLDTDVKIMIAGCSTGQDVIEIALAMKFNTIDAVDLSKWSLAYVMRKAQEILPEATHDKIKYYQADFQNFTQKYQAYDLIICNGAIAENTSPVRAFRSLKELMAPHSFIRFTLPSKTAHTSTQHLKKHLQDHNIDVDTTQNGVHTLQQEVWNQNAPQEIISLRSHPAFHNTPECIHHFMSAQKHLFSLQEIIDLLEITGIKLLGIAQPAAAHQYFNALPNCTDINGWAEREKQYPDIFADGYTLWAYKE